MAGGDPRLLAAATAVTGSVIDDGFADFLQPIVFGHERSTTSLAADD